MTISRLAVILVVIWLSSAIGLLTFLMLDLGPDFCQSLNGHNSTSGWNWPLPAAITGVQVVHLESLSSFRLLDTRLVLIGAPVTRRPLAK